MARRAILLLAIFIVLLGAGALLLPRLIDIDQYRGRIQSELQARLGRQVQFGALSLKVFPLSVSVANLVIQESSRFQSKAPFATAKRVDVKIGLLALLFGNVEVSSLRIVDPAIELIRSANGEWNYQTLGSGQQQEGGGALSLRDVVIEQGRIGITDRSTRKPRAVYAPIDINLREYTPGGRFDVDVAARLPGQGSQSVKASLRGTGIADIEGDINLDNATLSSLARFAGSDAASLDGTATGEVQLRAQSGVVKAKGKLGLPDGKLKNQPLGYPIDLTFDAAYEDSRELLTIQLLSAKLGALPLTAAGTLDLKSTPARVNMNVRTNNAPLTELARLGGVSGAQATGTLTANIVAQGALPRPALNGTIDTSALEIRGGEIKQAVKVSPLKLALTPDLIRSDPFTAQAGATSLNGSFTLANYTGSAPVLNLSLKAPNSQLAELLDIAKAFGAGADGINGTGAVSVDIRAHGKLARDAPLAISGSAGLRGASLSMPSLAKPLGIRQADVQFRQSGDHSEMRFNADLDELVLKEGDGSSNQESSGGALDKLTGGGRLAIASATFGKLTVQQLTADCTFDRGVIRLSPLNALAYKGRQTGSVTIDTRGALPKLDVKMQLDKADANQFLTATTSLKRTLDGLLNTSADVRLTPKPGEEVAAGLNGTASLKLNQGKLHGISLMNEAAGVAKILGFRKSNDVATDILDLAGDFNIVDGVASTENLAIKLDDGSATVTGTINLGTQAIDLRMLLTVGKGLTQQYGGNAIGGLLSTAFGNERGELMIPMLASGTMGNVRVAPDGERATAMKLKGLTGSGASPGEAVDRVRGLVDAFRKKK